jgi:hypothetical protein
VHDGGNPLLPLPGSVAQCHSTIFDTASKAAISAAISMDCRDISNLEHLQSQSRFRTQKYLSGQVSLTTRLLLPRISRVLWPIERDIVCNPHALSQNQVV